MNVARNGLESVSLVSFACAGGPDSAAQGDNLSKYESATREMVVWAVCSEQVSVSIPSLSGKIQGISELFVLKVGLRSLQAGFCTGVKAKIPC